MPVGGIGVTQQICRQSSSHILGQGVGARVVDFFKVLTHDSWRPYFDGLIGFAVALDIIYRFPLYQSATDTLNRQLKAGIGDHKLAELALTLREDGRLCVIDEQENQPDPKLICSMGLAQSIAT